MNEIIEFLENEPLPDEVSKVYGVAKELLNRYGLTLSFVVMIYNMGKLHNEKPFTQLAGR